MGTRRLLILCLAACLAVATAAAAQASSGEPPTGQPEAGNLGGSDTSQPSATNTDYTPRAQPGEQAGWTKIAGADFGSQTAPASSPTPFDTDFYSVSFQDEQNGLAAGSQCRRDPKTPDKQITGADTQTCERVPVIYRYTAPAGELAHWDPVYLGDTPGFVGAIAWIGPGKALAVGGTGSYPRRETQIDATACAPDTTKIDLDTTALTTCTLDWAASHDQAGKARAWLFDPANYKDQSFHELSLPNNARGLSALACSPYQDQKGYCVAGGLGQLWTLTFKDDGSLQTDLTESSTEAQPDGTEKKPDGTTANTPIAFRIRDIRFPPPDPGPTDVPSGVKVVAVTSGCCTLASDPTSDRSKILWLDGGDSKWHDAQWFDESYYSIFPSLRYVTKSEKDSQGQFVDRTYSYIDGSELVTSAKPAAVGEDASAITSPADVKINFLGDVTQGTVCFGTSFGTQHILGDTSCLDKTKADQPKKQSVCGDIGCTARLVSADGDSTQQCTDPQVHSPFTNGGDRNPCGKAQLPDGIPDWAVGVLRSSGQGIAYTTTAVTERLAAAGPFPSPYNGSLFSGTYVDSCTGTDTVQSLHQDPRDDPVNGHGHAFDTSSQDVCSQAGYQKLAASRALFRLPAYALNAYRAVGDTGVGWAVGDHGAILRLGPGPTVAGQAVSGGGGSAKQHASAPLDEPATYEQQRQPLSDDPGFVPPLAGQKTEHLDTPRFVSAGTPDSLSSATAVSSIAMSRDGSEGWAVGSGFGAVGGYPSPSGLGVYHYHDGRWSRCPTEPIAGVTDADPACTGLSGILIAITRVPLEKDSDPTNDDQFEAVAVGVRREGPQTHR